ncbi:MAG: hypothetical protein HY547_02535 [Elusimicrobia bacterium]|nr:hypothetical protein [Elusimicrobiota bacterium]
MALSILLSEGQKRPSKMSCTITDLQETIRSLGSKFRILQEWRVDDIIGVLDACAKILARPDAPLRTKLAHQGLAFLLSWLRESYLRRISNLSLRGRRDSLDRFVRLDQQSPVLYRALPRGIAAHWVAGNVPILGFLSIAQALITKNVSIAKAPTQSQEVLPQLLSTLSRSNYKSSSGRWMEGAELLETIAVVHFDHDDQSCRETLSKNADLRVAWGGTDAIESIESLPKKLETEDIIFGPKYSFAAIGRESLNNEKSAGQWADRLALDVAAFDQYACSSPQTVFVESGGAIAPLEFAQLLSKAMIAVGQRIPKAPTDAGKVHEILDLRAAYDLKDQAFYSKGTDWTVLYSDEEALANPCFSRVIFVRSIGDIMKAASLAGPNTQTVGLALSNDRRLEFAQQAGLKGALRLPVIGAMSAFDTPWDGMFPMDRMVKWVTTYDD